MANSLQELGAAHWLRDLAGAVIRFFVLGFFITTPLGFILLWLGVKAGLKDDYANYLQAIIVFALFYPVYRKRVFVGGRASIKRSLTSWGAVKIVSTFVLTPIVFSLYTSADLDYRMAYVATTASLASLSFLLGLWSFGKSIPLFRKSPGV